MSGIFISKGMTLRIPIGGLSISMDGSVQQMDVNVEVVFDVCPSWLEVALEHLMVAKDRNLERAKAWKGEDNNAKGRSLENEFKASMQAITAAAIAVDAFYATVRDKVKIEQTVIESWRQNKTARYAQIAEVCRIAFQLRPESVDMIRRNLKMLFQFRDKAVHPSSAMREAVLHPELQIGVEWRFVSFRFENALPAVWLAVNVLAELTAKGKPSTDDLQKYVSILAAEFESLRGHELIATYSPRLDEPINQTD